MCVADHFGLDDPESPLITEARAAWSRWCAEEVELAVVEDLRDLPDWTRRVEQADKDRVFASLAARAETDNAARIVLVWLLIPGASTEADRLRDLTPDIDGMVASQLWIEVARSHRLPPHGIARAVLNCTRRGVLAELGIGDNGRARDRVWHEKVLVDDFEGLIPVQSDKVDPYDELVELLDAALRDHAIEGFDVWLLHQLAAEAHQLRAPLRRGRCGLTGPAIVDAIARLRPEAARTLRRRVGKVVDQLAAYVDCWQDAARLAQWRAEHPERILTEKELLEEQRIYDAYLTTRGQGPERELIGTDGVPLVLRASA